MINLMIYISPTGSFDNPRADLADNDAGQLAKIQIENSIKLGWGKKDILLVTNFPFEYADVKALVVENVDFFDKKPQVTKINAILKLFEMGLIKKDEVYWFHDLDAFQLVPFTKHELEIKNDEILVTDFGGGKFFMGTDRYSGGVFYFKDGSRDIFEKIIKLCYEKRIDEEEALGILVQTDQKIAKRVKKINNSYNFIGYNFDMCYKKCIKPLKVVHFHPRVAKKRLGDFPAYHFFKPLITDQLKKLLKYHRLI